MNTQEIADRLYELCSQNKYEVAQRELYSSDAESIEPAHSKGLQSTKGLDNIIAKGDAFQAMVEDFHGGYVNNPQVFGNYITMEMGMDVTMKNMPRSKMKEMALYEVKDGKIISEQFLF